MKEAGDFSRVRVNAGQIGSLVPVAVRAGKRKVLESVRATVLPRDDVLHMKSQTGVGLRDSAVFAVIDGAFANLIHKGAVHDLCTLRLPRRSKATSLPP
jgi:hypothetical protein